MGEALITRRGGAGGGGLESKAYDDSGSIYTTSNLRMRCNATYLDSASTVALSAGESVSYIISFDRSTGPTIPIDVEVEFAAVHLYGKRGSYSSASISALLIPGQTVTVTPSNATFAATYTMELVKGSTYWEIAVTAVNNTSSTVYRVGNTCYFYTAKIKD